MAKYKLIFTVPIKNAEAVRQAIGEVGAGKSAKYSFASFSSRGIGRFKPEEGAHPHIGTIGTLEEVEEERVECQVDEVFIDDVLVALKKTHPYEEIAYDLFLLDER